LSCSASAARGASLHEDFTCLQPACHGRGDSLLVWLS